MKPLSDHFNPIFILRNFGKVLWVFDKHQARKIEDRRVILYNVYHHAQELMEENVDGVILTTGKLQNASLQGDFKGAVKELHVIGDAHIGGARIGNAIFEGQRLGRTI